MSHHSSPFSVITEAEWLLRADCDYWQGGAGEAVSRMELELSSFPLPTHRWSFPAKFLSSSHPVSSCGHNLALNPEVTSQGTSSNLYNMETTNFGQRVRVRGNAEWVVMLWYSGINRVWRHGSPVHLSKLSIPIVIFNFSFKLPEPNF